MEKKGSLGWGITLTFGGFLCFGLGMAATTTIIFAFVGIPMMLLGFPFMIWGVVLLSRAKRAEAKEILREGVGAALKEGLPPDRASHLPVGAGQLTGADLDLSQHTKKCPACAEQIKLEALVCRFCGQKFDEKDVQSKVEMLRTELALAPQDEEKLKEKLNVGLCPKCDAFQNFDWGPEKITCKSCGSAFVRRLVA